MLARLLREAENPPVPDAANRAPRVEDERACSASNPIVWLVCVLFVRRNRWWSALFDLGKVARPDLHGAISSSAENGGIE
jgi:hypothetical protein